MNVKDLRQRLWMRGHELGASVLEGSWRVARSTAAGAVSLPVDLAHGTRIGDKRIARKLRKLKNQEDRFRAFVAKQRIRYDLAGSTVICGDLLANYMFGASAVPAEVTQAFELAYPRLAETGSFLDHASRMNEESLAGLVNGVKGKLFELAYLDELNNGLLEPGYVALLADCPIQPGWDIKVVGPDGDVASLLQLKATQHVGYARQAIERYPEVDVVVPKELAMHLEVIGLTEAIGNGVGGDYVIAPMTNESLQKLLDLQAQSNETLLDCIDGVPVITLAVCALQGVRAERGARLDRFGELAGPRCLLLGAGLVVSPLITPVGGMLLVIGAGFVRARGQQKRLVLAHLDGLILEHKKIFAKRRRLRPPLFYKLRRWLRSFWIRQTREAAVGVGVGD